MDVSETRNAPFALVTVHDIFHNPMCAGLWLTEVK